MSRSSFTRSSKLLSKTLSSALLGAIGFFAASSPAQQLQDEISMQRFDPAPGMGNFLTTRSAAVNGHLLWTAGLMANYGYDPFSALDATGQEIKVVENMVTADLMGSISLIDRLQIGLKIPVSYAEGHGAQPSEDRGIEPADGELSAVGLGDIQLEVKGRFYGEPGDPAVLGAYLYGTAPMGTLTAEESYIGNTSPSVGGAFIFDGAVGPFSYGINLGGLYRKAARLGGDTSLGAEARWTLGLGYKISPIIGAVADVFGATNFSGDPGADSIEADAALRITPLGNKIAITVGGGAGIFRGVGSPAGRVLLGFLYNAETTDRDQDGLVDTRDACPDAAEDLDGFEDDDGCPEADNDQDGLPDDADKCINEPEDVDGFEDKDGCPEPDNDKDGLKDVSDRCPDEPENMNGFEDEDGCPDVKDTDSDGVPDDRDECVNGPEDTDGFKDTDGCPDPDNDEDGIPDEQDECIDQPEDGQGEDNEPTDGCPMEADLEFD